MVSRKYFFIFLLFIHFFSSLLYARHIQDEDEPLFAGTLLSIYAKNPKACHSAVQPYLFLIKEYGVYNQNSELTKKNTINRDQLFIAFQTGILDNFAIGIFPYIVSSRTEDENYFSLGDFIVFIAIQVANNQKNTWIPDCRILIEKSFLTGK